jgi:hypothetical protein
METTLYQEKYTGSGSYHDLLNDSSFIDFMIINEFTKNVDGYRLSSYLYKGKNDRLNCGPIWDFNLGYGNANYYNGWLTSGFQYQASLETDYWQIPFWWNKLLLDEIYVNSLKKRWMTLRKKELSNQRITFVVDSLANVISEAKDRNYQRWPILGQWIWPNAYVGADFNEEVNWMKNWITDRLFYLDSQWPYNFTDVNDNLVPQSYSVFPNPFSDRLTVQLAPAYNGAGKAEIFNMNGSLVREFNLEIQNGQIQLVFSGSNTLCQGLYVVQISQNDRILLKKKAIKTF